MRASSIALTLAATLAAATAMAAPPQTLHVTETVEIKAPPDKVWTTVKDFDGMTKWHPGFTSDQLVSGGNGKVGATRKLTIKDGPVITERLLAYDEAKHSFRYAIIESPLPITDYVSSISVHAGNAGMTKVTWS